FPFVIMDILERFTGIPSFVAAYFNGSSWVNTAQTTLTNAVATNTRVIDGTPTTLTYNATGRQATWIADFTSGTLPTNFSLSRSSQAYQVNASGFLTLTTSNTPRWDRDPTPGSGYPIRGLMVEGSTTNLIGTGAISEDVSLWDI